MRPRTTDTSLSNAEAREAIYKNTGLFPAVPALETRNPLRFALERIRAWARNQEQAALAGPHDISRCRW